MSGRTDQLQFYAARRWLSSTGWLPGARDPVGGSAAGRVNILDARGGGDWINEDPSQHFADYNGGDDGPADTTRSGFRSVNSNAYRYTPLLANGTDDEPTKWNSDEWGVDESGSQNQLQYHSFSCSKCHNPHASRLPKLLITNCLDTKHNTWDNNYQLSSVGTNNTSRSLSNWTSAQNCHRRGGVASGSDEPVDSGASAGVGAGWNVVTPW